MPRATIDLQAAYGLDYTKGVRTIGQDMNLAAAQALFPTFYTRMTTRGPIFKGQPLTSSEFLQLSWFDACWGEAVWSGLGGGQNITTGYLNSQNGVIVPKGYYYMTIPAEFSAGRYKANGTGFVSPTIGSGNDANNSRFAPWHEQWLGSPTERHLFVSGSWGLSGNQGYVEGTWFEGGWRFDGRQDASTTIINDAFYSTALRQWKPGEVTGIDAAWAENFRTYGFEYFGATPSYMGNISAFQCVQAGLGLAGSWGATMNIDVLSSDACGAMFEMYALAGAEQGGTINIGAIKNETMVASAGRSFRGQVVGVLRGQFAVNIGVLSGAVGQGLLPALFVADSRLSNGNPQRGHLKIGSMKGFNFQNILHDIRLGRAFPKIGDYQAHSFEFDSAGTTGTNSSAWWTGNQSITPTTGLATFRVNHQVGSLAPINMSPTATPYREIIVAPPAFTNIVYLDGSTPTPPAPSVPTTVTVTLNPASTTGTSPSQATAVVFDQNGLPMTNAGTWSITSGNGTVSTGGLVTPGGTAGSIVVRYTQGAAFGEATLTVSAQSPSVPTTVTVTLSPTTILSNTTSQAAATVLDQFGGLMPLSGTWSIVSGPATISGGGLVTPSGAGSVVVRYTQGSAFGNATLTVNAVPVPPPNPPLYDVDFVGQNILSLPGCQAIPASQNWKAGTLTGAVYSTRFGNSTAYNTLQRFTTPIAGVRKIVLKNAVIKSDSAETPGFKYLNDRTRTNNSRQFFQTGTNSSISIGSFTPNAVPQDIIITFATAQSIATLFGSGISGQTNCLWLECTGVAMYANP
jgi:hypothetical protein